MINKNKYNYICIHCHTNFMTMNTRKKYCSDGCSYKAKRIRDKLRKERREAGLEPEVISYADQHAPINPYFLRRGDVYKNLTPKAVSQISGGI